MLVIPAVDIKNGRCVRLIQGDPNQETVYSDSPVDQAKAWEDQGAKLLHIVDLDGAFEGVPKNLSLIEKMRTEITAEIELGGGIRDLETISRYKEIGIDRIIVGSAAFEDRVFLKAACEKYADSLIVGIDVVDMKVAIHGWKNVTETGFYEFVEEIKSLGVGELIVTDISRDGMLGGIDPDFYREILEKTGLKIIASGGVGTMDDLRKLKPLAEKGLRGAIVGKALYEKRIDLAQAVEEIYAG